MDVQYNVTGDGPPVLLLPAPGAVCTRAEMWPLARQLERRFYTVAVDWPGFGAAPRPRVHWQREFYQTFLADFCEQIFDGPVAVVAAGHSCAYTLQVAHDRPATWSRIALIAPTWRGPLPTALGDQSWLLAPLQRLLALPVLGEVLYRISVAPPLLAFMYRNHVYGSADRVTPRLITEKGQVARQRNGRYASAAFITGALDAVRSRADFLELIDQALVPVLAVCGTHTPARAWQEMATLCQRTDVTVSRVPGALAPHEEHPAPVSRAVTDFLLQGKASSR
jgi:pimeloyl-ACP methyl ester carboxylesterase